MDRYDTTTNAIGLGSTQAGEIQDHIPAAGRSDSGERASSEVKKTTAGGELPTGPEPSSSPALVTFSSHTSSSEKLRRPTVQIKGIRELVRTSKGRITSWQPSFEAPEGTETSFTEIMHRTELLCAPLNAMPVPTGSARYVTTEELFIRLQKAIAAQGFLPAESSALLSYWVLSTWFCDALTVAPGLAIIGSAHDGDAVLRSIRCYSRCPVMMTGVNMRELRNVIWQPTPTLLFWAPTLTSSMAALLGCTTRRGYLVADGASYRDFYGFKACYLGEEAPVDRIPHGSLQVNVHLGAAPAAQKIVHITDSTIQDLQNQLLRYRTKNLVRVYKSNYDAPALGSETRTIASALGACLVDAPQLQSQLISLLTPLSEQQEVERASSLEGVTLEAALNLCHAGKAQVRVVEIAAEVNRIVKARGERLNYSPERIGHRLRAIGLRSRRLGSEGRGFAL